jgi:hypothetical protein
VIQTANPVNAKLVLEETGRSERCSAEDPLKKSLIAILLGITLLSAALPAFASNYHRHHRHHHHHHAVVVVN